jgi:hypothetical protein
MEESRMAIAETLKVTNRVDDTVNKMDDKVMVLIGGGENLWLFTHS